MDSADSNNLQTDKNENYLCCLCKKDTDNVIIMGQMKTGKKFKAHYYCLVSYTKYSYINSLLSNK